jgi:cyclic pyranopterin phosphate synthase
MTKLTHVDDRGRARMVDVGAKPETARFARAFGILHMAPETAGMLDGGRIAKGDVLAVARVAGIMAAKRCGDLIPLCHPLPLAGAALELVLRPAAGDLLVIGEARVTGRTGVEMEAMTAVSVAALTVYDMCKAVDRGMTIGSVALLEKSGGRSGHYINPAYGVPASMRAAVTMPDDQVVRLLPPVTAGDPWHVVDAAGKSLLSFADAPGCPGWARPQTAPVLLAGGVILVPTPAAGKGLGEMACTVRRAGTVRPGDPVARL